MNTSNPGSDQENKKLLVQENKEILLDISKEDPIEVSPNEAFEYDKKSFFLLINFFFKII